MAAKEPKHTQKPVFRELSRDEAEQILSRNHVGRLACSFHDGVDIELIHYVYSDGWIYGGTSHEAMLPTTAHNPWVAFEVDEARGLFDWSSVVVKGTIEVVNAVAEGNNDSVVARGVELLRTLAPPISASANPASFRHHVFRIHVDGMTGREARGVSTTG